MSIILIVIPSQTFCRGSFSVVKRCSHKVTKAEYAVKIAHVSYANEKGYYKRRL